MELTVEKTAAAAADRGWCRFCCSWRYRQRYDCYLCREMPRILKLYLRRCKIPLIIFLVFVIWNLLSYYVIITSRPPDMIDSSSNQVKDVETRKLLRMRLQKLESDLKLQVAENRDLLSKLQKYRENVFKFTRVNSDKKNNSAAAAAAAGVGGAIGVGAVNHPLPGLSSDQLRLLEHDSKLDPHKVALPVLVIACNRLTVKRNLEQLIKYRPSAERFPIIVSQDCGHRPTADAIQSFADKVTHIQHPDLSSIPLPWKQRKFQDYYKISRHYKWAISQIFHRFNHSAVIIVEDDLDVSPDFFEYFASTYPILHTDPTLWCVSAWNDNGKGGFVSKDAELLYRTDFFPGLGWMLKRQLWAELEPKWPKTFWDDWMRHPDQRRERACIRPEISRTTTFGKIGASKGQFYEKHLKFIKLNTQFVPFTKKDLSYLKKDVYDAQFVNEVYSSSLLTVDAVIANNIPETAKTVRVEYTKRTQFKNTAKRLGLMDDLKSGVPRAGYRGVVSFMRNNKRIFLSPPPAWNGYDVTWN
ncbi:alpha-1,3-mannosyl-glycoprotein 2-beta-N-acetylglucosaminyltransferase-like [Tubulanus polymorphus]|uniref:alpha-1,3-mannosyl-glycoprotein 2-beta-N-acetylglucosaminyltransferase-like n=1 Tax=Tubulanus polymorphus TaxID=672921 RepID=UPI003DA4A587